MTFQISQYHSASDTADWDPFVQRCPMATWMHTRRFLTYHGDRFTDVSLILKNDKGQWLGVLPAAVDPSAEKRVSNHPGLSYGGLLHTGKLHGNLMIDALREIAAHYHAQGYQTLRYKAVPDFYHQYPCQDDLYALFRLNADRYRCDLASVIDIQHQPAPDQKRRWESQQAVKQGVAVIEVEQEPEIALLWDVLEENLSRKHGAKPVHSLADILLLKTRFPKEIRFVTAQLDGVIIAGFVLFITPMVVHLQYSASSAIGNDIFALHPLVAYCVELAKQLNCRYFDFGISNEKDGRYLNAGLHAFKSKFGAGGAIHEFYDLDLAAIVKDA